MTVFSLDGNEAEFQAAYAAYRLDNPHFTPFVAACHVLNLSPEASTKIASYWSAVWEADPRTKEFQAEHVENKRKNQRLPTREELAHDIMASMTAQMTYDERIKGFRLLAEIGGYIAKPGVVVNNNNNVLRKNVLIVEKINPGDWEERLREHEKRLNQYLIDDASDAAAH